GDWESRDDIEGDRADQRLRNLIIGQGRAVSGISQRTADRAEVARCHRGCGNKGCVLVGIRAQRSSLVSAKEKQLIFADRTSDGPPKLIALQCVSLCREE